MYYDDSNRHDEEKQQLNKIWYLNWNYYDESNKHNEENKQLNAVLLLLNI